MRSNIAKLVIDIVLFLLAMTAIFLFWHSDFWSGLIAGGVTLAAFILFHAKEDVVFFIIGAAFGEIGEILAIAHGAWEYTNPLFFGTPLWLPLVWGFAFLISRRTVDAILRLEHHEIHYIYPRTPLSMQKQLLNDMIVYALIVLLVSALWHSIWALFAGLLAISVLDILKYHSHQDTLFFLTVALLGPLLEMLAVSQGIWSYTNPNLLGVPVWLFLLYGAFGHLVRRTSITACNYLFRRPEEDV